MGVYFLHIWFGSLVGLQACFYSRECLASLLTDRGREVWDVLNLKNWVFDGLQGSSEISSRFCSMAMQFHMYLSTCCTYAAIGGGVVFVGIIQSGRRLIWWCALESFLSTLYLPSEDCRLLMPLHLRKRQVVHLQMLLLGLPSLVEMLPSLARSLVITQQPGSINLAKSTGHCNFVFVMLWQSSPA